MAGLLSGSAWLTASQPARQREEVVFSGGGSGWEGLGATAPSNSGPKVLVQMKSALLCMWPSGEISSKTGQTGTYDALCTTNSTQLA